MRSPYILSLLASLLIAIIYWYQSTVSICPVPLSYRIGIIDPSFLTSIDEARTYASSAEAVWEAEVNRELFTYDENAKFTINFVFDERQATANSEEAQREILNLQLLENKKVFETVESLRRQYDTISAAYKEKEASYEDRLTKYNQEVNKYNDRGGAPSEVFNELENTRIDLNNELNKLSETIKELNQLVNKINELAEIGNQLVDKYNQEVNQYNSEFGYTREFTQGDHQGDRINIYKFSGGNELINVLAHEFGHALGIGHVDGSSSLMYYLLENTDEQSFLSVDDVAAYREVCGLKETKAQKSRRYIREFLARL